MLNHKRKLNHPMKLFVSLLETVLIFLYRGCMQEMPCVKLCTAECFLGWLPELMTASKWHLGQGQRSWVSLTSMDLKCLRYVPPPKPSPSQPQPLVFKTTNAEKISKFSHNVPFVCSKTALNSSSSTTAMRSSSRSSLNWPWRRNRRSTSRR